MRLVGRRKPARVTVLDGYRLGQRLLVAAREFGYGNPQEFLQVMRQVRRGYLPEHDGPSEMMRLVDEIADYERRESDRRRREAG